ncbi:MAG TPA: O-antigen ligase family protein [Candidatus Methylomirabilis sp.]|nr:O-antigen ligase family protein [Candidatus Methylomirabilis sp.]
MMSIARVRGALMSVSAPRLVLGILLLLATSNRALGKVAGLTFRLDLAGGVLAVGVVLAALALRRRVPVNPALLWLGGFVAVQVLSSLIHRALWPQGVKFSLIYVLALASVCAVLILVRDMETARWALGLVVTLAAAETVITVVSAVGGNVRGMSLPDLIRQRLNPQVAGAMSEANLFASLLLVPFAVALWRWTGPPRATRFAGAASLVLSTGLAFALTRAAWIGALGIMCLSPLHRRVRRRQLGQLVMVVAAATVLLLALDLALHRGALRSTRLYDRLARGAVARFDAPLDVRLVEVKAALPSWRESPWFGHGVGSGKLLKQYAHYRQWTYVRQDPWLSNGTIFVLHDSGLVGLTLLVVALGAAARQWWNARARITELNARLDHEALAAGLAAVLLAWQVTHGLWQMYGYLYLGLLLAMSRLGTDGDGTNDQVVT